MTPEPLQLRDLVPADPLLIEPGLPWWLWLLGVLSVAGLLGIPVWYRLSERGWKLPAAAAEVEPAAYEEAARRLEEIAAGPPGGIQPLATEASATLRRYLTKVSGDPTLFETHEEFVSRHDALKSYPEAVRQRAAETFGVLAGLKYGSDRHGDPHRVIDASRSLLEQLHQQTA